VIARKAGGGFNGEDAVGFEVLGVRWSTLIREVQDGRKKQITNHKFQIKNSKDQKVNVLLASELLHGDSLRDTEIHRGECL